MFVIDDEEEDDFGKLKKVFEDPKVEEEEIEKKEKEIIEVQNALIEEETDRLAPITISKEMRTSFLEYAMSVIVSRALPDARDGLKPVHRRILYGMNELGITSSSAHKKSARIVGDVLGKYHPHGDSAVYEAMVRMAQDFSMRYPMVDGHGNFGSVDGDGAAAMRYTEARMSKIAMIMIDSIKKDTVDFVDNYDGSDSEPVVLPARIPNLLITGATGIAVGMATSIPPHSLSETIDASIAYARNKDISIAELMHYVPAPDFPTGGLIIGKHKIPLAYETGRGSVTLRSKTHIEELKNGKARIIVTEIPYMVNKARLVEKIAELVRDKVIEGITDLRDETSRRGIRIVIELRRDIVPEVMTNKLFKLTPLQTNFSMNMLALVNGQPITLNLKTAIQHFIEHQEVIVKRRTQFDLDKAQAREHILEGLKIAIENIDEVIRIIRAAKTDVESHEKLTSKFKLSAIQAKAITDMRLGRLNGLATEKMNDELAELKVLITELQSILDSEEKLTNIIVQELTEIKDKFGDDRRSEITDLATDIDDEDLIPEKNVAITMSNKGYVKRVSLEDFQIQRRGGVGSKSMSTYEDDQVEKIIVTSTHTDLLMLTTYGKIYKLRAHQIPALSKQAKGIPFLNLIDIEKKEKVVSILTTKEYEDHHYLATVTKLGIIKKTSLSEYKRINKNGKRALGLKDGDMLIRAMIISDDDEIIIGASNGKVVRFSSTDVRAMGRSASGVKGINIADSPKLKVVGTSKTTNGEYLLSISKNGFGKLTILDEYRITSRGAKGVKTMDVLKAGSLRFVRVVKGNEDILITTKDGITIRTTLEQVARSSRSTKGVKIITLKAGNSIESIAIIRSKDIEEQVEEAIRQTQEIDLAALKALENPTKQTSVESTDEDTENSLVEKMNETKTKNTEEIEIKNIDETESED